VRNLVRFWLLMTLVSVGWSIGALVFGDWAGAFSVALSGAAFLYLAHRSADPNFLG